MELSTDLLVAIVAIILSVWGQLRAIKVAASLENFREEERKRREEETERAETHKVTAKYREPLARAAYDLQSRLYNLVNCKAGVFLDHPDQRLRGYFAQSTLFLLSQYFAWMELTRRDLQFVDLGDDEETKKLYELTERIAERFSHGDDINVYTGAYTGTTALWIFKMEQRAIGESMIIEENGKPSCLGYGAFVERLDSNPLLALLGSDLADRAKIESNCNRLVDLLW